MTAVQLLPLLDDIVAVDDELTRTRHGRTYFPLTRYGSARPREKQEIRAAEAYFVKFPVELFDVIPGIEGARILGSYNPTGTDVPEDFHKPGWTAPGGRTTRAQDPDLRAAIERRSLDVAREYYEKGLHGTGYAEVGAPYDIDVTVDGLPRRAEVKGSSLTIDTVELTINEVQHASEHAPVDLIVVDAIEPVRDPNTGKVVGAAGGRRRVWTGWIPEEGALAATGSPTPCRRPLRTSTHVSQTESADSSGFLLLIFRRAPRRTARCSRTRTSPAPRVCDAGAGAAPARVRPNR